MSKILLWVDRAFIGEEYQDQVYLLLDQGRIVSLGRQEDWREQKDESIQKVVCRGTLWPGLIDAHTHIGLEEEMDPSGSDTNEMGNPIQPALRVIDGIQPSDGLFAQAREEGITTVGIFPGSSNLIGGLGASLYTAGRTVDEMLIESPNGLKGALGENPKRDYGSKGEAPFTRMGEMMLLRKALYEAVAYQEQKAHNLDLFHFEKEPLCWLLERKIPLRLHAHRADDICSAIRLADEFRFSLVIEHATGAAGLLDEIKEKKVGLAIGPLWMVRSKREMQAFTAALPALLEEKGIPFCLITDGPELPPSGLRLSAMLAKKQGLSERAAILSITWESSRILRLDHRMGKIEKGYEANLVLFQGDPLDFYTKVGWTMIKGEFVYGEDHACAQS